jgi:hypothetical protein
MDSKRRFLEAASRYYELSSLSGRVIGGMSMSEDDVTNALRSAIICTVLAAVGGGLMANTLNPKAYGVARAALAFRAALDWRPPRAAATFQPALAMP